MALNREEIEKVLGANFITHIPYTGDGVLGAAHLGKIMSDLLARHQTRPVGLPANPSWTVSMNVPMSENTAQALAEDASQAGGNKVSPMQIAAQLLEEAVERANF